MISAPSVLASLVRLFLLVALTRYGGPTACAVGILFIIAREIVGGSLIPERRPNKEDAPRVIALLTTFLLIEWFVWYLMIAIAGGQS